MHVGDQDPVFLSHELLWPRGPDFASRAADCMFSRGDEKHLFCALLKINVLIFFDMVWFGFWYSPTMHLGHHFYDPCAIFEVCVAVSTSGCNKLAGVGWSVVKLRIFISFFTPPIGFKSEAHTFVVKRCRRRRNNNNVRCPMSSNGADYEKKPLFVLKWLNPSRATDA